MSDFAELLPQAQISLVQATVQVCDVLQNPFSVPLFWPTDGGNPGRFRRDTDFAKSERLKRQMIRFEQAMSLWKATPPKDDRGYFERMTTHLFSAGLNWKVVENKKAGFDRAFSNFSPTKVAKFTERDVKRLMKDTDIVRNEKKIRATIHNAAQFLEVEKEYGSFNQYLHHFGKSEEKLQKDLQERFHHMGVSTARMFLWSVGYPLKQNSEEKKWMASHEM